MSKVEQVLRRVSKGERTSVLGVECFSFYSPSQHPELQVSPMISATPLLYLATVYK